jgi:hypothetical protein
MGTALESTGYLLDDSQMMIFLGAWIVLVLVYGFYRSIGNAEPDPIRPSGPPGVLDRER